MSEKSTGKTKYPVKLLTSIGVCFLFTFMLLIFSPAETYFANAAELPYVYGEFGWYMMGEAIIYALLAGLLISFLPKVPNRIVLALGFGVSLCAYVQNMFLNKGLDMMGLNAAGYSASGSEIAVNLIIWIVLLALCVAAALILKNNKLSGFGSLFLLAIQLLALISLYTQADESCYSYPQTEYHLDGTDQFRVSAGNNVIMFVVDCFSDLDLTNALAQNPQALSGFEDFTFYDNMDSVYCGTYPSMTHMLTNTRVDFGAGVNEWTRAAWNSEKSEYFYSSMAENNYVSNLYTIDLNLLCGSNNYEELLEGKISNFDNAPLDRTVDNETIRRTMLRMAAYRMAPKLLKNYFYVNLNEYYDVVTVTDDPIMHENYDFYAALKEKGLSADETKDYFIVQHIMGTHLFENDEYGNYKEDATAVETALGCLNIVREYIGELKRLGVYDAATIIMTADHGVAYGQQPVFFIKNPYDSNDEVTVNSAPVTFDELLPTIAEAAGIDASPIGETIYAYSESDVRERTLYVGDYREEYPSVPCYYGDKIGTYNVYVGYTYSGDENELLKYIFDKPSQIIPMVESYF